ncbi:MAG TPA: hypothetical protein DEQ32_02135 [Gammaproteobacteria bacterium]|nr:hypothetical protein [Gammaproteobacteria bacterium]
MTDIFITFWQLDNLKKLRLALSIGSYNDDAKISLPAILTQIMKHNWLGSAPKHPTKFRR